MTKFFFTMVSIIHILNHVLKAYFFNLTNYKAQL